MRSRSALTLILGLMFSLIACTSKPPATDTTASDSNNPGGVMAPNNSPTGASKPAAEPLVIPAGTTLTVRLG